MSAQNAGSVASEGQVGGAQVDRVISHAVPWVELTDAEKIARLRFVAKMHDQRIAALQQMLEQLTRHQHAADGSLMAPMRFGYGEAGRPSNGNTDDKAWI